MSIDEFQLSTERARRNQSATKILNELNTQRKSMNPLTARRWIWELMQNAKDVAYHDQEIKVSINHCNGELAFKHNGRYFSVDNVISLIEQVSSKERDDGIRQEKQVTGKFGTGFLSTHLLSEVVSVTGVVELVEKGLNSFSIILDRTGKTIDEINNGIDKCHENLKETYNSENRIEQLNKAAYNTIFKYRLNEKSEVTASEGIEELYRSAIFMLAFVPKIKSINIENSDLEYSVESRQTQLCDNINLISIDKRIKGEVETCHIVVAKKNETSVAIEVKVIEDEIYVIEFNEKTPRIFCDFPLIGTEGFSFPAVINNPLFDLNEPRDDIFLSASDNEDVLKNKEILVVAVELFQDIINLSVQNGWRQQYLFAQIPDLKEKRGFDIDWFTKEVTVPLKDYLLRSPIVETADGKRVTIERSGRDIEILFPSDSSTEVRNKIWDLINKSNLGLLPRKDEIDIWYGIKWINEGKTTLTKLLTILAAYKSLDKVSEQILNGYDVIEWMNEFFGLVFSKRELLNSVANSEYALIPNQYGEFLLVKDILEDTNIDDVFKDILLNFNNDIRKKLKHKKILLSDINFRQLRQELVIEHINKKLQEETNKVIVNKVCDQLIGLIPTSEEVSDQQQLIINYSKQLFKESEIFEVKIGAWDREAVESAFKLQIKRMVELISSKENILNFSEYIGHADVNLTSTWFNNFVDFLVKYEMDNLLSLKHNPILPDQNGLFCHKDEISLDDGEIDERLKDICKGLGYDFKAKLLIKEIYLELPEERTRHEFELAEEISKIINSLKDTYPRVEETKRFFKDLLIWFYDYEDKAKELFRNIFKNKHWLYDDEEIAENMKKAEAVSLVMDELGIENIEDLRNRLMSTSSNTNAETKEELTNEILASLGITTSEEYELLLKNKDFVEKFHHTSKPSFEMLDYSQRINKRSKERVIEYLDLHPDYDCENIDLDVAPTILAGIKKKDIGEEIYIVVRPSDNGKILFYNPSETKVLELQTSELWIQGGISNPEHLTLGTILKVTGINKIPLR